MVTARETLKLVHSQTLAKIHGNEWAKLCGEKLAKAHKAREMAREAEDIVDKVRMAKCEELEMAGKALTKARMALAMVIVLGALEHVRGEELEKLRDALKEMARNHLVMVRLVEEMAQKALEACGGTLTKARKEYNKARKALEMAQN